MSPRKAENMKRDLEFEARFPVPPHIMWLGAGYGLPNLDYKTFYGSICEEYNAKHEGWLAGREGAAAIERVAKLEKDTKRLDWLDENGRDEGHGFCHLKYGEYRHYVHQSFAGQIYPTAREVIDKAMEGK